ncbi:hypothetical protein R5R35_011718 [Gryllus longicercus]|uniref:Uncharacterized protein n=1 Tax=Gryllus longicercus TaxID=2509291 RepID=A0AAN9Z156_9ORTH
MAAARSCWRSGAFLLLALVLLCRAWGEGAAAAPGASAGAAEAADGASHCKQCGGHNAKFCCKFFRTCCDLVCGEDMHLCYPPFNPYRSAGEDAPRVK